MNDASVRSTHSKPVRVLVVEDESLVAMMLADMLGDLAACLALSDHAGEERLGLS